MRVVVDTNVIVSGLLNPYGTPAAILRLVLTRKLEIALDSRIILEYRDVLQRPKFHFSQHQIDALLGYICRIGLTVSAEPLRKSLPDPDDNMFLEVALASRADCIITGNKKHFPQKICGKVKALTPVEFLRYLEK